MEETLLFLVWFLVDYWLYLLTLCYVYHLSRPTIHLQNFSNTEQDLVYFTWNDWNSFLAFRIWQCINFSLFKIYKGMTLKYWKYTFKFIILIWIFCFWWTILIRFISPKYTFNLKRKNIYIHFQLINLFWVR